MDAKQGVCETGFWRQVNRINEDLEDLQSQISLYTEPFGKWLQFDQSGHLSMTEGFYYGN